MEIKDVQANQGNIDIVATISEMEEPRTFEKFGKEGRVCNAKLKDDTGEIKLTLWNDDIDKVKVGDKVHLENGWCSEYRDERQLSSGKFGKIEVVAATEPAAPAAEAPAADEIMTNSPDMLQPASEISEPEPEVDSDNVQEE